MKTIARDIIKDMLWDGGLDVDSIYEKYSGRGMYGKECFGIVVADLKEAFIFFAQPCEEEDQADLKTALAERAHWDSMGLSTIIYFPGYQLEAPSE